MQSEGHARASAVLCLILVGISQRNQALRLCGSVQWSRAVTSKCWCPYYHFKEMHPATYLAAVNGPGLVL